MLRRALVTLSPSGRPVLRILDGEKVQVVPNVMSVDVEQCELANMGADGADRIPVVRMTTRGLGLARELSVIRGRDIMRPRDSSMLLSLLDSVHKMVRAGAMLDESVEIPLETSRKERRVEQTAKVGPDGFDHLRRDSDGSNAVDTDALPEDAGEVGLWLTFYAHPSHPQTLHCLLLPPAFRELRHALHTPLRSTNLLFKHHSWDSVPPAVYADATQTALPSEAQLRASVLHDESTTHAALKVPLPGASVTLRNGRCHVDVPLTTMASRVLADSGLRARLQEADASVALLASRHEGGVDGFLCWDPQREMDSFVIATEAGGNLNEHDATVPGATEAQRALKIGATFLRVHNVAAAAASPDADAAPFAMLEDGVTTSPGASAELPAFLVALTSLANFEGEDFSLSFTVATDVSEPPAEDVEEWDLQQAAADFAPDAAAVEKEEEAEDEDEEVDAPMAGWLDFIKEEVGVVGREMAAAAPAAAATPASSAPRAVAEEDDRRKNLSRAAPTFTHVGTEVRPMGTTAATFSAPTPEAAAASPPKRASIKTTYTPVPGAAAAAAASAKTAGAPASPQQPASAAAAPATAADESPEEHRTVVEPRMTKADFGEMESDSRAQVCSPPPPTPPLPAHTHAHTHVPTQDEAWEPYVIRVATVLSAVFSHCGRRTRPTKGKEEPGSVTVEVVASGDGGPVSLRAFVDEEVCGMELIPDVCSCEMHSRPEPHPLRTHTRTHTHTHTHTHTGNQRA